MIGRRVASFDEITRPGDYFGPTNTIDENDVIVGRGVWFLLPTADPSDPLNNFPDEPTDRVQWAQRRNNGMHRVSEPPWTFRECADGSLEIRESIACGRHDPEGEYFHGYLDEGHAWRVL